LPTIEYQVSTVKGLFKSRTSKIRELQKTCDEKGAQGWELVSFSYDWLLVSYTVIFKREKTN